MRKTFRPIAVIVVGIGLALALGSALESDERSAAAQPRETRGKRAQRELPNIVAALNEPPPVWLTADGLVALGDDATFDRDAVARAFPDQDVVLEDIARDGILEHWIRVRRGGVPLVSIRAEGEGEDETGYGAPISIWVSGYRVSTPEGVRLGSMFDHVRDFFQPLECWGGTDADVGTAFCWSGRYPTLGSRFQLLPDDDGRTARYVGQEIPEDEQFDALGGQPLELLVWMPL